MTRRLVVALLASLAVFAGLGPVATAAPTPPALSSFDPADQTIEPGSAVLRTLRVTNTANVSVYLARSTFSSVNAYVFELPPGFSSCRRDLSPGASCTIGWNTTPGSELPRWELRVALAFADVNDPASTVDVSYRWGGAVPVDLYLSQPRIDLGEIPLGSRTDLSTDLVNDRSSPLEFAPGTPLVSTAPLERRTGSLDRLPAGTSRAYTFGVRPTAPGNGSATATFNFADGTSPASRTLTVQWTAVGPQIAADPPLLQFDPLATGASQTRTLKLSNTGNRTLTITNPRIDIASDVYTMLDPIPSSIEAGGSVDVRVRCKPNATGEVAGRIIMGTNDPAHPTYAPQLRCTGTPLALTFNPLVFSTATVGSSTTNLRLYNATNAPITISGYTTDSTLTLPELDAAPQTVQPDDIIELAATWAPSDINQSPPALTVKTSVGDYAVETVGRSVGSKLVVSADIGGANATDFGDVPIGTEATGTVTIRNVGTKSATVDSLSYSGGGGQFTVSTWIGTLSAGQSRTASVRFRPSQLGQSSTTVRYTSPNATYGAPGSVTLTGRGVGAVNSVAPSVIDFGETAFGTTKDREVTVTNSGTIPLTFNAPPTVTGAGFSVVSPDTSPVPVGGTRRFTVRFSPTESGATLGVVGFSTNAYGGDPAVLLGGTGSGPAAEFHAAPLATDKIVLPETAIGSSRTRTITLKNTGDQPLEIAYLGIGALTSAAFTVPDGISDAPVTLEPGASREFTLRFAPARVGLASGNLLLLSNAGTGQRVIPISGTGYVPGVPVADPTSLAYGEVEVGQDRPLLLSISNRGPRAFTITGISTPSSDITVDGLITPVEVTPNTGRGFTVRWTPSDAGSLSGDVVLDTTEGQLRVPLTGMATSARLFSKGRPVDTGGGRPTQVALGDFNGDGDQDLATAYAATGRVAVALGAGDGTFAAPVTLGDQSGPGSFGLVTGDFNGDGDLDLTTGPAMYLGGGDGTFTVGGEVATSDDLAAGDFDADGITDLAFTRLDADQVFIAYGRGDATFDVQTIPSGVDQPGSPITADVNRDGNLDLVVGGRGGDQQVAVFLGTGARNFSQARYDTPSATPYALAVGDLNNDQRPDVSAAHSWLAGKADGTFAPAADGSAASDDLAIADFDGDGFDDQVVAGKDSPVIFVSRGLGDGTFDVPDEYDVGTTGGDELADLATGDLNGDGRVDAVAAKGGTQVDVLLNRQGTVTPGAGKAVISELRFGAAGYVQVQNTSRTAPLRLDGWQLAFSSGARVALHTGSALQPGGTLLVSAPANAGWPFASLARSVLALPGTALSGVRLVDAEGEPVDAAGFDDASAAFREGTAISSVSGSSGLTYLRKFSDGARVDTDDNASDFVAVDPEATEASGLLLGSPRPDGLTAPTNRNDILQSSLLDPSAASSAAPNRVIGGGKITINRTITNCIGQPKSGVCVNADTSAPGDTVTKLRLRITDLTTIGNAGTGAILKVVPSVDASYGGKTVQGLPLDAPTPATGGGLNSTLTATLPAGGLGPGESVNVAITFEIVRSGAYRIGYDAEDDLVARPKATPGPTPTPAPGGGDETPVVIDPAPAPAAPAAPQTLAGTLPASAAAPAATKPAPAGTPKAPTTTPAKRRCVTRAKYRKLTKKQRAKVRVCAPSKTNTSKTTSKKAAR